MAEKLPTPETIRVGATIREMREMRGLKCDELASKILVSRSYLANIEAGRKRLQPELAAKIATVLAVRQIAILRPDEWPADLREAS
jgi:transcriptional regulator with XRE-family HTH domain